MTHRPDRVAFRVLLIEPSRGYIYVGTRSAKGYNLPALSIPRWSRVTPHLQAGITKLSGHSSLVLDFSHGDPRSCPLVVARTTSYSAHNSDARLWIPYKDLSLENIVGHDWKWIERLLTTGASGRGFYSRIDWYSEVLEWVHSVSPQLASDQLHVEQLNASSKAALICIRSKSGKKLWFKSMTDEYEISLQIACRFPAFVPPMLAHRTDWNAWLMGDGGRSFALASNRTPARLGSLGLQLARLQIASYPVSSELATNGFQDLRTAALRKAIPDVLQSLARARQERPCGYSMRSLQDMLIRVLEEWDEIQIPDALSHTDLNLSNILTHRGRCVFIDWANAAVASPFVNFVQIHSQLSRLGVSSAAFEKYSTAFLGEWSTCLNSAQLDRALRIAPVLEAITRLCARRHWLIPGAISPADSARCSNILLKQLYTTLAGTHPYLARTG